MSSRSSSSASSSSSSSSSTSSRRSAHSRFNSSSVESGYYTTYLELPKDKSKSVRFLAWMTGAPPNSNVVKRVTRESLSSRSSVGTGSSRRGAYISDADTELFWVTEVPSHSSRSSSRPGMPIPPHLRPGGPGVPYMHPRAPGVAPGPTGFPGARAPAPGRGPHVMNPPGGIPAYQGAVPGVAPAGGFRQAGPAAGMAPPPQ